jgi:hypothetical protein
LDIRISPLTMGAIADSTFVDILEWRCVADVELDVKS